MHNFTNTREVMNFTLDGGNGAQIANGTLNSKPEDQWVSGDNWVLNDTETREVSFVINGKNLDEGGNEIRIDAHQCFSGSCTETVEDVEISEEIYYWSDPTVWPENRIPEEGDEVEILPGWNMIIDVEETPLLALLTINGRLTFSANETGPAHIHIHSYGVFVYAGELIIGTEEEPYPHKATITLYGDPSALDVQLSGAVEAGNKVLINTGYVSMVAPTRDMMTRLRQTAKKGDREIFVYPGLDWAAGDKIFLAPSAVQWEHVDHAEIQSYSSATGMITLMEKLDFYHYGQDETTGDEYNGLDMRTEVILLTRDVKIVGDDTDAWGGNVLTTEAMQADGVVRAGQMILDGVEIRNCSQRDTVKAALRFEGVLRNPQKVSNTVIWGNLAWGVRIESSYNVEIYNSAVVSAQAIGVAVVNSN